MTLQKDWTGNSRSTHAVLGARNYAQNERENNDYYATEPKAAHLLMEVEQFSPMIWECACGEGHLAKEFVEHALDISSDGCKVAMFLKIQFLEGKARRDLFEKYPPKTVYVSSSRLRCAMNGDFEKYAKSTAVCYAWYVWVKGYTGDTVIKWIN